MEINNEINNNPDLTNQEKVENISEITELKDDNKPITIKNVTETIRDFIIIGIIVIIIRTYIMAPFQISGSSMETSYHDKEFLLVNKLSYAHELGIYIGHPVRGDVVIFRPHASKNKEYYIKRVIGVEGDTVKFQDGEVFLKQKGKKEFIKLNEDYLSATNKGKTFLPFDVKETQFTVPKGEFFLMGDNRNNSSDSRSCFMSCSIGNLTHFIKRDDIIGKVFLDFGYFNIFKHNEYTQSIEGIGLLKWIHSPRLLNSPKSWEYKELK